MYKPINLRKEVHSIENQEEILQLKQLIDGRFAVVSGSLTNNKLLIYNDKNIDLNNKNKCFMINEFKSPITSINQCTDESLLVLTLDAIITVIKLLPDNKYSIIQNLNAIKSTSILQNNNMNENKENNSSNDENNKNEIKASAKDKEEEKLLNYKKLNSRLTTMVDFTSCIVMQLSNCLLFSIYDKILKFYQVNIIHNLYDQVKRIELYDIFNEPLEIDSSTLIILSWSSQSIHFYNIDTQLLLKRVDQVNAYITCKISEEHFCAIGPKYLYLLSTKEQEIRNVFNIPDGYEIRSAICSPSGSLLCTSQTISSCDFVEFEINVEEFNEMSKIINPHKNDDDEDGIKVGSSLINAVVITQDREIITTGCDRKIKYWN